MRRLLLVMSLLWQLFHSSNGGGANGFSPFYSLTDLERYTDNRQLLIPTLNFTCNATIVAWRLILTSTVSEDSPAGSVALQVWRNQGGAAGEQECLELVQETIYSQVLARDERVQLTLSDSRFFLNVSEGDFLGFFLFEEGLSPLYHPDSSNMTVLQSASKETMYCFTNGTISPSGQRTLNVSPMVEVEIATLPVVATETPSAAPSEEFSIPNYVVYVLVSLLVVVSLLLVGGGAVGVGLLARRRSLHGGAKSDSRCRTDRQVSHVEEHDLVQNVGDEWLLSWRHAALRECFAQDHHFKYYRGTLSDSGLPMATRTQVGMAPLMHVSVKVVKDNKSEEGLRVFWERVLLLRKVTSGNHCHVAQLVGCIVQELPAAILVEYSAEGDLLTYLRTRRTLIHICHFDLHSGNTPQVEIRMETWTGYEHMGDGEGQHCPAHLRTYQGREEEALLFAQQIASGMEYLFSVGVADHALSCRTVLMAPGKVLKVASFDPSPDEKEAARKWAAPECIKGEESTEKSHMWSYGLTLLEVCTQGELPYANLGGEQRAARLMEGRGVARPRDCLPGLYELMLQCWKESPQDRPSFAQIHQQTRHMQDQVEQRGYASVFAAGQRVLTSGRGIGRGISGVDGYMPMLAGTMEPPHSYAVLVQSKPVAGREEGRGAGLKRQGGGAKERQGELRQ